MIAIWIFRNKYKSFEKKIVQRYFDFLKMTVLLKDPKGALWCSMTSKKIYVVLSRIQRPSNGY